MLFGPGGGGRGSYRFTALAPSLVAMGREVEALGGGGEARVGCAEVVVRVRPAGAGSVRSCCLALENGCVALRDPRMGEEASIARSVKRFKVGRAIGPEAGQEEVVDGGPAPVGEAVVDWVMDGYSANVVAFGESGAGKTWTMHGPGGRAPRSAYGVTQRVLVDLVQRCEDSGGLVGSKRAGSGGRWRLGLACWDVSGFKVDDLLAPDHPRATRGGGGGGAGEGGEQDKAGRARWGSDGFTTVGIASAVDAARVLQRARKCSANWADMAGGESVALANRAHSFLRVVVHDVLNATVSTLHMVDLVGSAGSEGALRKRGVERALDRDAHDRARVASELLAFSGVVGEMARAQAAMLAVGAGGSYGGPPAAESVVVLPARNAALTQQLAPLLAGNAKTWFIACVSAGPESYVESLATVRLAARSRLIHTACLPGRGIEAGHFVPLEFVVPPTVWMPSGSAPPPLPDPVTVKERARDAAGKTMEDFQSGSYLTALPPPPPPAVKVSTATQVGKLPSDADRDIRQREKARPTSPQRRQVGGAGKRKLQTPRSPRGDVEAKWQREWASEGDDVLEDEYADYSAYEDAERVAYWRTVGDSGGLTENEVLEAEQEAMRFLNSVGGDGRAPEAPRVRTPGGVTARATQLRANREWMVSQMEAVSTRAFGSAPRSSSRAEAEVVRNAREEWERLEHLARVERVAPWSDEFRRDMGEDSYASLTPSERDILGDAASPVADPRATTPRNRPHEDWRDYLESPGGSMAGPVAASPRRKPAPPLAEQPAGLGDMPRTRGEGSWVGRALWDPFLSLNRRSFSDSLSQSM